MLQVDSLPTVLSGKPSLPILCWIKMTRVDIFDFVPHLRGNVSRFSPEYDDYGFVIYSFYYAEVYFLHINFVKSFFLNHKWILNFVTRFFSAAIEKIKLSSFQYPREGSSWCAVSFALCPHMADRKRYLSFSPCKYSISIMGVPTSSVQFSYSIMSDSLQPHGLQETRLPCPAPTPGACSNCWVD